MDDSDDAIAILLDTYNDKRTSRLFIVNPLSTLSDAKVTDDGKNMDFNWDMEWEAKAIQTPYGWSVELVLPYSSMQFAPKKKFGRQFFKSNPDKSRDFMVDRSNRKF